MKNRCIPEVKWKQRNEIGTIQTLKNNPQHSIFFTILGFMPISLTIITSSSSSTTRRIPQTHYRYPSLSLLLIIPLFGAQCPHRAGECRHLLTGIHWCVHVKESIGERRLWVCPYFLLQQSPVCLPRLNLMGGKWPNSWWEINDQTVDGNLVTKQLIWGKWPNSWWKVSDKTVDRR